MSGFRITHPAAQDLEEIYDYIAGDNLPAAGRLVEHLTETFRMLANLPGMGRNRDDLLPGLQSFPVGAYLIFYGRPGPKSRSSGCFMEHVTSTASSSDRTDGGPHALKVERGWS